MTTYLWGIPGQHHEDEPIPSALITQPSQDLERIQLDDSAPNMSLALFSKQAKPKNSSYNIYDMVIPISQPKMLI